MTTFLTKIAKDAKKMAENDEISLDDLPFVISAYGNLEMDTAHFQKAAVRKFLSLTPTQCANMMIYSGSFIEDPELVEICEKVVASGVSDISSHQGGPSFLFETLKGFMSSPNSRDKIV
jgi:hypothetical protein